jgi:molybdopterin molybdotransferase
MMQYAQALEDILASVSRMGTERVALDAAAGRVLARRISAPWDMPRFDQSAMDGFAVVADDVQHCSESHPVPLRMVGAQRIGRPARKAVERGTAIKIFTGSMLPPGADAVVMREYASETEGLVSVVRPLRHGENVRRRGEEFTKGTEVLAEGTLINPAALGILASLNKTQPHVYRRPSVTCIVTGDEVVSPGERLAAGRIYDSNGYALGAAIDAAGVERLTTARAVDDEAALEATISAALEASDVVLTVGGASVGDHDYVRAASSSAGVKEVFWRVKVKPGKPVLFGRHGRKKLFFGLPGNPVSALVSFHQFVRPALLAMSGRHDVVPEALSARLRGSMRKKPGRLEWVRGHMTTGSSGLEVSAVVGQDSHMLSGLAAANCLVELPESANGAEDGDQVRVVPLCWGA